MTKMGSLISNEKYQNVLVFVAIKGRSFVFQYNRILVDGQAAVQRLTVDNLLDSLRARHPVNQVQLTHVFTDVTKFRPEKLEQLAALLSNRFCLISLVRISLRAF